MLINNLMKITNRFIRSVGTLVNPKLKSDVIKTPYTGTPKKSEPKFKYKDQIIIVNNEDENYEIGKFLYYENFGGSDNIPIIELDGRTYTCFSHLEPYSEELCKILDKMDYIQQWNYLVHDSAQLSSKKGIPKQTYECQCEACKEWRFSNGSKKSSIFQTKPKGHVRKVKEEDPKD